MSYQFRGPDAGYDFAEKAAYRESVWSCFAKHLNPATAHVAFFPGAEGLEIPVALRYGFKVENLHAIDDDPELLESAVWRKYFPQVSVYCGQVEVALDQIATTGVRLNAVHLDFCSSFSAGIVQTMKAINKSEAIARHTVFAILLLNGREAVETFGLLQVLGEGCPEGFCPRIHASALSLYGSQESYRVLGSGKYHGSSSMTWGIVIRRGKAKIIGTGVSSLESRERVSRQMKERWANPEFRANQILQSKKCWEDPQKRQNILNGMKARPGTKPRVQPMSIAS
jgi:hypothetical protein